MSFTKEVFIREKMHYLDGDRDVLGAIFLAKSNYSNSYYVECDFCIKGLNQNLPYPNHYQVDVGNRIVVLSKTQTINGEKIMTAAIEYEHYSPEELRPYFDKAFEDWIMPPIIHGKKVLLEYIKVKYYAHVLREKEIMEELQR